jgi:conjugal transfer pilus assembly protein TraV
MAPGRAAAASSSLRSNPRLLRLWIAPWEDADGDLHEQALVHVVVDSGRWLIEHVRPATGSRVDGVAPPVSLTQEPSPTKAPAEAPQPRRATRCHSRTRHPASTPGSTEH